VPTYIEQHVRPLTTSPPRRRLPRLGRVAVIAHTGKTLGGGLDELRTLISAERVDELLWYEVPKSSKAPAKVRKALKNGADLVFVWGGDGMVQQCADALVGSDATIAIIPAGTANLLAHNLGIPHDLTEAVHIGFHGQVRQLDLGRINGEHFAVLAGVGAARCLAWVEAWARQVGARTARIVQSAYRRAGRATHERSCMSPGTTPDA
jgi:diacylglycerol kinase family enzyme